MNIVNYDIVIIQRLRIWNATEAYAYLGILLDKDDNLYYLGYFCKGIQLIPDYGIIPYRVTSILPTPTLTEDDALAMLIEYYDKEILNRPGEQK